MRDLVFWDVDTQVDFVEPGGKLYVPGAEKIVANIRRLNEFAAQHNILVVSSVDAHQPTDPEFAYYPPHCLAGTPGQQKVAGTMLDRHFVVPNRKLELPENLLSYQQIIVEKQATDVFTNPNIEDLLKRLGRREVILYGVVTEICVARAARGLRRRGYRITLVRDAVQHLDEALGRATSEDVISNGGTVRTTDQLLQRVPTVA